MPGKKQMDRGTPSSQLAQARKHETHEVDFGMPSLLDAPPCPPGYVQRWIRCSLAGREDSRNVLISERRAGWTPRPMDSIPEGYSPPTMRHGQLGSVIGVGDLILCWAPKEAVERDAQRSKAQFRAYEEAISEALNQTQTEHGVPIKQYRQSEVEYDARNRVAGKFEE